MKTKGLTGSSSTKRQLVSLLRDFAREIQAMDDSQIERILAGELRIEVRVPEKSAAKTPEEKAQCSDHEIDLLRQALQRADSREQAGVLIDQYLHSKADMIRFARILDIPAPQKTSSKNLKNRLVEATVGYRLRSAAIRGDMSASSDSTGGGNSNQ